MATNLLGQGTGGSGSGSEGLWEQDPVTKEVFLNINDIKVAFIDVNGNLAKKGRDLKIP